jgi:hypothetical protein
LMKEAIYTINLFYGQILNPTKSYLGYSNRRPMKTRALLQSFRS